MAVISSAGTRYLISPTAPATYDKAGFDAIVDWVEVGEVTNAGEVGGSAELITYDNLTERKTKKLKGTINYGSMQLEFGRDKTDAGQQALDSGAYGANIDVDHSHQLVYQDNTVEYFSGLVMSKATSIGAANNVVSGSTTIELTDAVIDG